MTFENRNNEFLLSELLPFFWNSLWKILPDLQNWFRISGTVVGPVVWVPGQLPEVRDSFPTPKTVAALTEHKVLYLKVLGITVVHASSRKTTAVRYQLDLMGLPLVELPVAKG